MGRGTGAQALKDQTARQKGFTDTASKEEQQTFGTVTGADKDIIANPVSEAEKQARTQGTLQPLAESFDASSQAAGNLTAKSRNFSGYQSSLDKQAQERAQKTAQANQALTADIGNTEFARRNAALGREAGMFGTATGATTGRLGEEGQLTSDYAKIKSQPGFWDKNLWGPLATGAAKATTFGGGG